MRKHRQDKCLYLHVKNCAGCGRSCDCYKIDARLKKKREQIVEDPMYSLLMRAVVALERVASAVDPKKETNQHGRRRTR